MTFLPTENVKVTNRFCQLYQFGHQFDVVFLVISVLQDEVAVHFVFLIHEPVSEQQVGRAPSVFSAGGQKQTTGKDGGQRPKNVLFHTDGCFSVMVFADMV